MAKGRKKKLALASKRSRVEATPKLEDLVRKITPRNRHAEISVGPESGKERVEW
jgi:antitoxin component of MazEF toxin-antitoxin module